MRKKKIKNWEWKQVELNEILEFSKDKKFHKYDNIIPFSNIPLNYTGRYGKIYHNIDNALILIGDTYINMDKYCIMIIPQIEKSYGDCNCIDYSYPTKPLCFIGTNIHAM